MKKQTFGPHFGLMTTGFWKMPFGHFTQFVKRQVLAILPFAFCLLPFSNNAQSFKRQVIGSVGTNHIMVGNICIAATTGQPPNAGTIGSTPNFILRQGFQQPNSGLCGLQVSFDVTPVVLPNNCGTSYIFEYTGTSVPGLEVTWSFGSNAVPMSFDGLISPNVTFSQPGVATIMLTLSTGVCQANFSKTVQVMEAPFQVAADVLPAKCYGDKGSVKLDATGANGPFQYLWEDTSTDPNRPNLAPGTYAYSVMDSKGCVMSAEAEVKGADEPLRILPETHSATCDTIADGSIELNISGGVTPYQVLWNDDIDSTDRKNIVAGTYAVTVTDGLGCSVSKGIKVGELCKDPGIPDTFTPNGDGVNDTWEIPEIDRFPNHEVRIFNRWGNVVFAADGNYTPWHGTNTNGEELPASGYFFVIKLNDPTGIVWTGSVTIIR